MTHVSAIIPVKPLSQAKTRMAIPASARKMIMLAMFVDTAKAVAESNQVRRVYVVTRDPDVAWAAAAQGVTVLRDHRLTSLNHALLLGRQTAASRSPSDAIAMIPGDLPALAADELDAVIAELDQRSCPLLVTDHHNVGTTMLLHPAGFYPAVAFGEASAAAHTAFGYRPVVRNVPSLRQDIDSVADLRRMLESSAGAPSTRDAWRHVSDLVLRTTPVSEPGSPRDTDTKSL
jgi:2-phospho-L-lactate/phosphoenolpyruvate guanylyltransferase